MLAWVVGAGGLLGSAVSASAQAGGAELFTSGEIPWGDPAAAQEALAVERDRFRTTASSGPWAIAWCAGSSIVASTDEQTAVELQTLSEFVDGLRHDAPQGSGVFFLASSAGGVYAGSDDPPFTLDSTPRPVSPYGALKLDQERVVAEALTGVASVVIGRLSNLYGPRTDSRKGQGLVPSLCRATVHRTPLNLYVSMDTIRDYLFADDAGDMVWEAIVAAQNGPSTPVRVEIMASGEATTVARAISVVQTVAHRKVPLALGTHGSARHQVIDLRLIPTIARPSTRPLASLSAGVKRVLDAVASEPA